MANLDRLHEQSELLRSDYERSVGVYGGTLGAGPFVCRE